MDFEKFKILVKGLKAVYVEPWFLPDADSIKIWYNLLGDLDYTVLSVAIQRYMMSNAKAPTIADLREAAAEVVCGEVADWSVAWEKVTKAIGTYGMYRVEEAMESFDELTREVVKRMGFYRICTSDNVAADRANFRTIYTQLAERKKADNQISEKVRGLIGQIQGRQMMLEDGRE